MKKAEELLAELLETLKKADSKEKTTKAYKGYVNASSIDEDTEPKASFEHS